MTATTTLLKPFRRMSLFIQFCLLLAMLVAAMILACVAASRSLVEAQARNQARVVADVAESVGNWVDKYQGAWVRSGAGAAGVSPGVSVEGRHYSVADGDLVKGVKIAAERNLVELGAVGKLEGYHLKNADVVRREIGELLAMSVSTARYKATAPSVINQANAPTAFDMAAMSELAVTGQAEYSTVQDGQLLLARRIIANDSCLACHGSARTSNSNIRAQFPGAAGYGYQSGKMAGVISVAVLMPSALEVLTSSMSLWGWVAVGAALFFAIAVASFVLGSVIAPVNRLTDMTEQMLAQDLDDGFRLPKFEQADPRSRNEVHRLANQVYRAGRSLRYVLKRHVRDY